MITRMGVDYRHVADLARWRRMRASIVDEPGALEPYLEAWAQLAADSARPMCLPAWMLAWWRNARPARAALRVVLVHDAGGLAGVAPYFAQAGRAGRVDYRLLASGSSHRIGPVCRPGREDDVGRAVALAFAPARPSLVSFEGVDAASSFPRAVAAGWPGRVRPRHYHAATAGTPVLELAGGFDAWLGSRSANFRQQMRQSERRLAEAGGRIRLMTAPEDVERALAAFAALHVARWAGRGGTALDAATATRMLLDAARPLVPAGQLRLWCAEVGDRIVCVQVFVAAGGELSYWNGGWAPEYARCRPALATIHAAVRDAFARGERRIDFGGGEDPYKLRFAGTEGGEAVSWSGLFPVHARYPLTRVQLAPAQVGWVARRAVRRLPASRRAQLRRVLPGARA
jgi:CelD/BcsL family acetyltransferase involved in cellulose biosynthesis